MDVILEHYDAIISISKLCYTNRGNTIIPEGRILDTAYPEKFPDEDPSDPYMSFGAIDAVNVENNVMYTFHHKYYVVDGGFFNINLISEEFEKTTWRP